MKALWFDGERLALREIPPPELRPGWARLRVRLAGICRTDLELTRGYMGFRGVLGHEFVGEVIECADTGWVGKRVAGEINAACGTCEACRRGLGRHCPTRSVLGILNMDGCLAEECQLPAANLHEVPDGLSDRMAVFTEPVSAACEILDQVPLTGRERAVVLGDGKLGILCAWVLGTVLSDVTLVGRHPAKLERARWGGLRAVPADPGPEPGADLVVEATGRGSGLHAAMRLCRPRGTLVLKSTVAAPGDINLAPLVIHEITVVGSRCGRFETGLARLRDHRLPVERLIEGQYPLDRGLEAFEHAARPGVLKILIGPT
jgi:alcohol dehydrogenase